MYQIKIFSGKEGINDLFNPVNIEMMLGQSRIAHLLTQHYPSSFDYIHRFRRQTSLLLKNVLMLKTSLLHKTKI